MKSPELEESLGEVQQAFLSFHLCFSTLSSSQVSGLSSVSFPTVVMPEQMAYMYFRSCLGKWNLEGFFLRTYPVSTLLVLPFALSSCRVSQAGLGPLTWSSVRPASQLWTANVWLQLGLHLPWDGLALLAFLPLPPKSGVVDVSHHARSQTFLKV